MRIDNLRAHLEKGEVSGNPRLASNGGSTSGPPRPGMLGMF